MKAPQKNTIGKMVATLVVTLFLAVLANAQDNASATIRLGVILVPTVQAAPQPAAPSRQLAMGNGAILRIEAASPALTSQVRELELMIGQQQLQPVPPCSAAAISAPQTSTKLVQTTFVAY
jgi:hypothetical protein